MAQPLFRRMALPPTLRQLYRVVTSELPAHVQVAFCGGLDEARNKIYLDTTRMMIF